MEKWLALAVANPIWEGLLKALYLIVTLDSEILGITSLSLQVSTTAVLIGGALGVVIGSLLALSRFRGKFVIVVVVNTLMGLPPVVVGLVVYLVLSRSGPMGFLDLIFTPSAMVIAQVIIVTPIVAGLTNTAMQAVDSRIKDTALSLGANRMQFSFLILREARSSLLAAFIVAFGRAVSEVGAILVVGGNIRYFTRALTTAIVLETNMGDFDRAIALGIILLTLAFLVNIVLTFVQQVKVTPLKRISSWIRIPERS